MTKTKTCSRPQRFRFLDICDFHQLRRSGHAMFSQPRAHLYVGVCESDGRQRPVRGFLRTGAIVQSKNALHKKTVPGVREPQGQRSSAGMARKHQCLCFILGVASHALIDRFLHQVQPEEDSLSPCDSPNCGAFDECKLDVGQNECSF
jgi:hypothetical protein